jgi:hypothetical protein
MGVEDLLAESVAVRVGQAGPGFFPFAATPTARPRNCSAIGAPMGPRGKTGSALARFVTPHRTNRWQKA